MLMSPCSLHFSVIWIIINSVFPMLGTESRTFCVLGEHSPTESNTQSLLDGPPASVDGGAGRTGEHHLTLLTSAKRT